MTLVRWECSTNSTCSVNMTFPPTYPAWATLSCDLLHYIKHAKKKKFSSAFLFWFRESAWSGKISLENVTGFHLQHWHARQCLMVNGFEVWKSLCGVQDYRIILKKACNTDLQVCNMFSDLIKRSVETCFLWIINDVLPDCRQPCLWYLPQQPFRLMFQDLI